MNDRETVSVALNVLAEAGPKIPDAFRDSRFAFLANTHPALQREFAAALPSAELIVCDTMDLWIENEAAELRKLLEVVHGLVLNDAEARQLTGQANLVLAGRKILEMGPRFVVIKKGEHGSMLIGRDQLFLLPPYPTTKVIDPTGCGDSFAGGMMGYIASHGSWDDAVLRSAMARGSVVASFVIESFSMEALSQVSAADVDRRTRELIAMSRFD